MQTARGNLPSSTVSNSGSLRAQPVLAVHSLSCRFCHHANPSGAKFCNECGSPLHLRPCPRCEAVTDASAGACISASTRADGVRAGSSRRARAVSSAPQCSSEPDARSSAAAIGAQADNISLPHSARPASPPLRRKRRPGSRPRSATRYWFCAITPISAGVSGGLSASRQCSRNTSRKRIVTAGTPTGENGSTSRLRTSTYSTPRSVSACAGTRAGA